MTRNGDGTAIRGIKWSKGAMPYVMLLVLLSLLPMTACFHNEKATPMPDTRFVAEIASFAERAYHRDFEDGSGCSYDVTVLSIQEPSIHRGRQMSIIHAITPISNSVWRIPKSRISYNLSPEVKEKDEVFEAAILDLRIEN